MNQADLIAAVTHRAGTHYDRAINKADVESVLKALADIAGAELIKAGGEVPLPGLGKFKAEVRAARTGRNPSTGAELQIPEKTVVKFSPAKALKDALS